MTLTFSDRTIKYLAQANPKFNDFISKAKKHLEPFKYLCVPEFQEDGVVHYHMLNSLPYVPANDIAEIWGNGFIKVKRAERINNLGRYMTKYLTKSSFDSRFNHKKKYFVSSDLKRPLVFYDHDALRYLDNHDSKLIYKKTFASPFISLSSINYFRYELVRP